MTAAAARTDIPNPEQLDFMHIKVKVGEKIVAGDLSQDLRIPEDVEDLLREISRYPALFFYYSSVAEVAKREEEDLKRRYESWYSEAYLEVKRDVTESGVRATDAVVSAEVTTRYSEDLADWQAKIDKASYRRSILGLAAKAMLEKGNAAINVLSYKKQQMNDARSAQ